jgi:dienelactone hydrolase
MKLIIVIILGLLSSGALGNAIKIIPDGNYEFRWNINYSQEGKVEFLATDYVEITNNNINFIHMPCYKGLNANSRYNFNYKFSEDLTSLEITGKDVGVNNNLYIKNDAGDLEIADVLLKFTSENIKNNDQDFYQLKAASKYVFDDEITLTITRNLKKPISNYKCLYERIDFESATPKNASELNNGLSGLDKTNVFGRLFLPENIEQKVPLVVTVHPSMGFTQLDYFEWLSDLGVAVFDIQPYLSRGFENQWFYKVSEEAATIDAYKALDVLSKDPRIDKNKIILLGWSYGGIVANNAHQKFFIDKIKPENEFQAFISYYPFCSLIKQDIGTSNKPLTIIIGKKDRMCPYELCQDYIDIVSKDSPESNIHIFEDSYHRFDFNLLPKALNIGRAEKWNEGYVQDVIKNGKRYDIGQSHKDIMGPNGWSYISSLSDEERNKILDPFREDENYIGYNEEADKQARDIVAKIINQL